MLTSFKLLYPWALVFLFLPWILTISKFNKITKPAVFELILPNSKFLDKINHPGTFNGFSLTRIAAYCGWFLLVFALANPVRIDSAQVLEQEGYDIILAVDLSRSMEQSLAQVKQIVKSFALKRSGDRVGLVVFAEHAFQAVPLTFDVNSVGAMIDNLAVGMAGESTSIGDAIAISAKNLAQYNKDSRVLVLLTDGDDTSSVVQPLQAMRMAKAINLKIHTIGIGNNHFNANLLEQLSKETGGVFKIAYTVTDLAQIYADINKMERTSFDSGKVDYVTSYYYVPLIGAMLLLGFLFLSSFWREDEYAT